MIISEYDFRISFTKALDLFNSKVNYVVGPGWSGSIAAVYASHYLGIPFVPYKCKPDGKYLVVDTTISSGRTIRKASRFYGDAPWITAYKQEDHDERLRFWYEELSMGRGKGNEYSCITPS